MKTPIETHLLRILHLVVCINALVGGAALILQPDGSLLGMQTGWLNGFPFETYLIPGILLFFFIGIFPLLTCIGLWMRPDWPWADRLNLYQRTYWAWTFSLFTGIILICWTTAEIMLTDYFWLQPVVILLGILILVLTLLPRVQRFYSKKNLHHVSP